MSRKNLVFSARFSFVGEMSGKNVKIKEILSVFFSYLLDIVREKLYNKIVYL